MASPFTATIEPAIAQAGCRHLAVLVTRTDELPRVLVAFYALGVRRGGWLVHRSLVGRTAIERRTLEDAGLDVRHLEADSRMIVHELDPLQAPKDQGSELEKPLEAALDRGLQAMWHARFAVDTQVASFEALLEHDRHYERRFAGLPAVTLCPFIVCDVGCDVIDDLAELHDAVAVPTTRGHSLVQIRARASGRPRG